LFNKVYILFILIFVYSVNITFGQNNQDIKKTYKTALNFFDNEEYREDSIQSIMVSAYINKNWTEPEKIEIENKFNNPTITLEGITPDGQLLFINIKEENSSNLYSCIINGKTCNQLIKLDHINSDYWEGRIRQIIP